MSRNEALNLSMGQQRDGQPENTIHDVETLEATNWTSDAPTVLSNLSKIVIRGDRVVQAIEGVEGIDVGVAVHTSMGLAELQALVEQCDRRFVFQEPKGYVPGLMIPCDNDDLEECPPLSRSLYASIPLPDVEGDEEGQDDEGGNSWIDELDDLLVLLNTRPPAFAWESSATVHAARVAVSPAGPDRHPQSTPHGSNAGSKRPLEGDHPDRMHIRRRM